MKLFEDLVEELKGENLLEQTVIEVTGSVSEEGISPETEFAENSNKEIIDDSEAISPEFSAVAEPSDDLPLPETLAALNEIQEQSETSLPAFQEPMAAAPSNETEFYQKRATEEVKGLQMVEHVFSGVEREQMKVTPKPYDDLECKKALHSFLQISEHPNSPEHAKSEFHLMQETESWYSALSQRDRNISVAHLRRYCETCRPALSYEALISLARFYRNSPFSEQVRTKFDFIVTRIFTRELDDEKRELPFTREELIKHLDTLYSQWASISLYAANDDDSDILLLTLKFEEFMSEADSAQNFDELIKNDFFNRLRNFKESTNENFFAPLVSATAIECNIRVGNRFVDLIRQEREKVEKDVLEEKYGLLHDHSISESSSKTLQLIQLIREKVVIKEPEINENEVTPVEKTRSKPGITVKPEEKKGLFKVNKWLLGATILIVVVNVGLYIWMSTREVPPTNQQLVERVNLENSVLRDFIKEARITNSTFFGVVQPNWNNMTDEKKADILKKIFSTSEGKGFSKVHLLDSNGKTVGYIDGIEMNID